MYKLTFTTDQILTLLADTPAHNHDDRGLSPAQLRVNSGPGEWSANDVLAHLRACADMWGGKIMAMVAEDHPTLTATSPRTWIKMTDYPELEFQLSFHSFAAQRTELLATLESLPVEGWSRGATVTGAGKPLEQFVMFEAQELARHERSHLKQLERIVRTMDVE